MSTLFRLLRQNPSLIYPPLVLSDVFLLYGVTSPADSSGSHSADSSQSGLGGHTIGMAPKSFLGLGPSSLVSINALGSLCGGGLEERKEGRGLGERRALLKPLKGEEKEEWLPVLQGMQELSLFLSGMEGRVEDWLCREGRTNVKLKTELKAKQLLAKPLKSTKETKPKDITDNNSPSDASSKPKPSYLIPSLVEMISPDRGAFLQSYYLTTLSVGLLSRLSLQSPFATKEILQSITIENLSQLYLEGSLSLDTAMSSRLLSSRCRARKELVENALASPSRLSKGEIEALEKVKKRLPQLERDLTRANQGRLKQGRAPLRMKNNSANNSNIQKLTILRAELADLSEEVAKITKQLNETRSKLPSIMDFVRTKGDISSLKERSGKELPSPLDVEHLERLVEREGEIEKRVREITSEISSLQSSFQGPSSGISSRAGQSDEDSLHFNTVLLLRSFLSSPSRRQLFFSKESAEMSGALRDIVDTSFDLLSCGSCGEDLTINYGGELRKYIEERMGYFVNGDGEGEDDVDEDRITREDRERFFLDIDEMVNKRKEFDYKQFTTLYGLRPNSLVTNPPRATTSETTYQVLKLLQSLSRDPLGVDQLLAEDYLATLCTMCFVDDELGNGQIARDILRNVINHARKNQNVHFWKGSKGRR